MAYSADFSLATNTTFQNQLQMSMVKAATAISNEARTIRNVVDQKRNNLAQRILTNPSALVVQFAYAAVEAGLTGTPTDAQVDTAVSGVWNAIAGITPVDLA
jgi:hypothetical protein